MGGGQNQGLGNMFELLQRGGSLEKWDNLEGFFFHFCP